MAPLAYLTHAELWASWIMNVQKNIDNKNRLVEIILAWYNFIIEIDFFSPIESQNGLKHKQINEYMEYINVIWAIYLFYNHFFFS